MRLPTGKLIVLSAKHNNFTFLRTRKYLGIYKCKRKQNGILFLVGMLI